MWPDLPLYYFGGDVEDSRRVNVLIADTEDQMCPLQEGGASSSSGPPLPPPSSAAPPPAKQELGQPFLPVAASAGPYEKEELEDEYHCMRDWLLSLKAPVVKIEYKDRTDGEQIYLVTYRSPVLDFRDGREKTTMQFQICGKHGATPLR